MSRTRLWIIGSVLLMIIIAGASYFLGVQPQLDAAKKADADRENVEFQNGILEADLVSLKEEFTHLDEYKSDLADLQKEIPNAEQWDLFLREIDAHADDAGVRVMEYAATDGMAFVPSEVIAPTVDPSITGDKFITIPVTVTAQGERADLLKYVESLQLDTRLYLITDMQLEQQEEDASLNQVIVNGLLYVMLDEPIVSIDSAPVEEAPAEGATDEATEEPVG